jgi:preprotein translocase subunit SecY
MAEEEKGKKDFVSKIARFLPSVEKPTYKQTFNARLKWTFFALLMYLVLSYVSVYGISKTSQLEALITLQTLLGAKFGSLMTLGIGPIVTGGIILQLLVGSKIINWDMNKPEGRKKFQTWNKLLAIIMCFVEAVAFVLAGALPVAGGGAIFVFVVLQLAMGGIIVILLDEIVSKWGFGSGVSLFIAVGVASQIIIRVLSPFTLTCIPGNIASCLPVGGNQPAGLFWKFLLSIFTGNNYDALINVLPIIATALVFLLVVYAQDISVDVPLTFSALRGFGRTWSLKLFYTSNIPVILAAALIANLQLMGHIGATTNELGLSCSMLACYDQQGNVVSGIVYYLSSPRNLLGDAVTGAVTSSEVVRALTYLTFLSLTAMVFSVFWVSTSGMDAASVAEQIGSIGMQIPGYRSDKKTMEGVLNRYIPALAVLGGLSIGLLAAFADFTGAIGTGTGILLTVMIVYNYYEELSAQPLEDAHPLVRKILE